MKFCWEVWKKFLKNSLFSSLKAFRKPGKENPKPSFLDGRGTLDGLGLVRGKIDTCRESVLFRAGCEFQEASHTLRCLCRLWPAEGGGGSLVVLHILWVWTNV